MRWSSQSATRAVNPIADRQGFLRALGRARLVWAPAPFVTLLSAFALALSILAGNGWAESPESVRGPALIIDGDSLEVAGRRFDLVGIDAPELDQRCRKSERFYACGSLAQAALMDLTAGTEVECRPVVPAASDGSAPTRARCSAGGYNLSEGMIYTGWALMPPGTNGTAAPQDFAAIQRRAEERRRGLWKGSFVTPWEWRSGERLPGE